MTVKERRELLEQHAELLTALQNMITVFEGDTLHPQGSIEAIRCSQAHEAIKKATK